MHYSKRMIERKGEDAVSPVVGVMLMLVVTIIIAAVVSAFAGGLVSTNKDKAPTISMDVAIQNHGSFSNSFFNAKVTGVSQPIPSNQLKLVTTWGNNGTTTVSTTIPGASVTNWTWNHHGSNVYIIGAPWGFGPGVTSANDGIPNAVQQQFGNYTVESGTVLNAYPAGQSGGFIDDTSPASSGYGVTSPYTYTYSGLPYYNGGSTTATGQNVDGMQSVLGFGWENLTAGNTVNVQLVYMPTGSVIYNHNVVVS
jgi:FlaG/FlaF family flagellin (archaellin)